MSDCVICQLIHGQIPAWLVYQDEHAVCFLPEEVQVYGHTVVAPKSHFADLYGAPGALLQHVIGVVQKMTLHMSARLGSSGMNLLHASGASAQQSVRHLHFHLIPRFEGDGLDAWPAFPTARAYDKEQLLEALRWPGPEGTG